MSSLHQLGFVFCRLHKEKLVVRELFLTAEYMSLPFLELDHHLTIVIPIVFYCESGYQYIFDHFIIQSIKVATFGQSTYVIDESSH